MSERIEIEIVGTGDKVVKGDDETKRQEAQERAARRVNAERRAQAREERAQEAQERQRNKAKRAEQDREDRYRRRSEREQKQFEKELDRQERERQREADRAVKDEIQNEKRSTTARRKFINDMLGAFNRAHLGRRVNHAIDFIQSLVNKRPIEFAFATAGEAFGGGGSSGGGAGGSGGASGGGGEQKKNPLASVLGLGAKLAKGILGGFGSIFSKLGGLFKGLFGSGKDSGPVDAEFVRSAAKEAFKVIEPLRIGFAGGKGAAGMSTDTGLIVDGAVTASRTGTALAATGGGGGGGLIRTGGAAAVGGGAAGLGNLAIVAGVLGNLAIVAGIVTVAFRLLDSKVQNFAKTLDNIPGPLLFAQIENDLKMFSRMLQRSNEYGKELASIERERGRGRLINENFKDISTGPWLGLFKEGLTAWNDMKRNLANIYQFLNDIITPVIKVVEKLLYVNNLINETSHKGWVMLADQIEKVFPMLGAALKRYLTAGDVDSSANADIMNQLYEFMGNPLFPQGQSQNRKVEVIF